MIAGMDEAGRGPAIGPLVFGLVIVTKKQLSILEDLGIDDSKKISKKKREELVKVIQDHVTVYDTLELPADRIDKLRDEMTLNEIEVDCFRRLVKPHRRKITELQLDAADVNAERFGRQFEDLINGKIVSRHKGDSIFVSVGAASILAKYKRDSSVEQLQQQMIDFDANLPPFGSGYPTEAKPFLEAYAEKYKKLPNIARKTWKTSINAIEKYQSKQTSLDSFWD